LQGYAAVAMPFCQHKPANPTGAMSDAASMAHAHHAGHEQGKSDKGLNCDDCAFCQLCAAPALPGTLLIQASDLRPALNPETPVHFFLFVPEQTQHPPLSL
ncbi:MAG: hypothetical protein M3Q32_04080, partial [Pseudomonadota bacterium]|nr:hypothetical protein [Pseudomonadota bacterium]